MFKAKYKLYLNPHDEYKWTKCPNCDAKTKVRKYCLMVEYEEPAKKFNRLISLNKMVKFCTTCELIIVQKTELEGLIAQTIGHFDLTFDAENYFIFGTLDKNDWKRNKIKPFSRTEVMKTVFRFQDVWTFDIQPAGWYFDDSAD